MNKAYSRINWENEPNISTPINATNLNRMDNALDVVDTRVVNFDTTKANESDMLTAFTSITYNATTGVFVFTKKNGTSVTVDLNIEKIPVSFSMDANGVITMTTEDGTTYTADIGTLIKTYSFTDSSVIDFTVTTDASGNKTVTATIIDGSITADKLQPNFLADCEAAQSAAEAAQSDAEANALKSEGYAVGTQNGTPVSSGSDYFENNAKFYAEQAASYVGAVAITEEQWRQIETII